MEKQIIQDLVRKVTKLETLNGEKVIRIDGIRTVSEDAFLLKHVLPNLKDCKYVDDEYFITTENKNYILKYDENGEKVLINVPDNVNTIYKIENGYIVIFTDTTSNCIDENGALRWKENCPYILVICPGKKAIFGVNHTRLQETNECLNIIDINTGLPFMEQDFDMVKNSTLEYDKSIEEPVIVNGKEVILDFINWKYIAR